MARRGRDGPAASSGTRRRRIRPSASAATMPWKTTVEASRLRALNAPLRLWVETGLAHRAPDELMFENGRRARSLLAGSSGVVLGCFRRADGSAGARLAGCCLRQPHADDCADRKWQDTGFLLVVPGPAGDRAITVERRTVPRRVHL